MAVAHAAVQTALAALAVRQPDLGATLRPVALAVVVAIALAWGGLDGRRNRPGQSMDWFVAALIAGPLAGLLGVIARAVLVDQTGLEALGPALTGGAAFTALLVLVPAAAGLLLGRLLATRQAAGRGAEDEPGG